MTLSSADRREAIASLASSASFQIFCDLVEESLGDVTAAMVGAKTDGELLRVARLWQVYFKYLALMRTTPQAIRDEALRELNEARAEGADPVVLGGLPWGRAQLLRQIEQAYGAPETATAD